MFGLFSTMHFQDRRRHNQLESGCATQTAISNPTRRLYTVAIQVDSKFPILTRYRAGNGRLGCPAGNCFVRTGGVTAMDKDEHGGPPPTVRTAP